MFTLLPQFYVKFYFNLKRKLNFSLQHFEVHGFVKNSKIANFNVKLISIHLVNRCYHLFFAHILLKDLRHQNTAVLLQVVF